MSEACPQHRPGDHAPPGPDLTVIEGGRQDPDESFFDDAKVLGEIAASAHAVLIDKAINRQDKAKIITADIIGRLCTHPSAAAEARAQISGYVKFADFLIRQCVADQETEIDLEILEEGLERHEAESPIGVALWVAHRDSQYANVMRVVTLATRLWTLDQLEDRGDYTTEHFEALRQEHGPARQPNIVS